MTETQPVEVASPAEPSVDQLAAALAAVQAELPRVVAAEVAKVTGETKQGKPVSYSYKYAGLATVADSVLPLLGKNGLSFTTWPTLAGNRFVLRYELLHASGQRIIGLYPLNEDIRSPQAMGSQITYARRYCLCAVTGVAPDDDDDAAAAEGRRQAQRAEQQAEVDQELAHGRDAVRGAWAIQFGPWDQAGNQPDEMYRAWSKSKGAAGTLGAATAGQLRAFAAYISTLPAADAGSSTPAEATPPADEPSPNVADGKLSRKDNAHMFVLFEKLGMKDDHTGQREYLGRVLERPVESRGEVRQADWPAVRTALEADVKVVEDSGLMPTDGSE